MTDGLLQKSDRDIVAIVPLQRGELDGWLAERDERERRWVRANGFQARPGSWCPVPDQRGNLALVLAGIDHPDDPFCLGHLPTLLPEGVYAIEAGWDASRLESAATGWSLGSYQFTRYRKAEPLRARLLLDARCDARRLRAELKALYQVRDLINTPAEHMGPAELGETVESLAREHGASVRQIVGDALLEQGYPAIHAVGRAATRAPRLVELVWGEPTHPRLALVGKGVCFDSGGLDIKQASGMRLMKKDMGGGAHAIGLAHMIMSTGLAVHLHLLVPAVENAIAGNAYRPGDVVATRKGISVEIDNTDAEGRVVLCDALTEACAAEPDLVIDFATLTGAARVALGTELPAMFCNRDEIAAGLQAAAARTGDPLWRLPLHRPYRELIDSRIADIVNSASVPYAGAITAALFLQDFVPDAIDWVHLDIMAWNTRQRPGRPEGGEAVSLRAMLDYLRGRYATRA